MSLELAVAWLGHATVDVRLGDARILTDPLLRDRVAHLRRHRGTSEASPAGRIDAVLISHLHHDHLDLPSIRRLPPGTPLVVPRGAGRLVARSAPGDVVEMAPGDDLRLGEVQITAVPADHGVGRVLSRAQAAPMGFVIERAGRVVYFPGDTDVHPVMSDLPAPDLALLPIWGWGRSLGPGHLNPTRAARAAAILRARAVLPVHWGTFAPLGVRRAAPAWLAAPADQFAATMALEAPDTLLRIVAPGPDVVMFPANPTSSPYGDPATE